MAIGRRGDLVRQFRALFEAGTMAGLSDGELLERAASGRGEAGDLAFAALVERHGPMVLRVCRKALSDPHDAHDAFQSTFLVLARKADAIRDRDSVASWLHGVALRVASASRSASARRRKHERARAESGACVTILAEPDDLGSVLHEEIGRLPGRYRAAVVLCYLEGKSLEEAAGHLRCPVGTIKSRLSWARGRLRERLTRRGLAPAAGAVATLLASEAAGAALPLPAIWVETTTEAALRFAAGNLATTGAGMVPASAAALAKGVIHAMFLSKIKLAAMIGAVILTATSFTVMGQSPGPAPDRDQNDSERLKSLMEKIDRLTTAMEKRAAPPPAPAPPPIPAPALIAPGQYGGAAEAAQHAEMAAANAAASAAVARREASRATMAHPPGADVIRSVSPDRLNQIEQRLQRLEQRMERLERRSDARPERSDAPPSAEPRGGDAPRAN